MELLKKIAIQTAFVVAKLAICVAFPILASHYLHERSLLNVTAWYYIYPFLLLI